MADDTSGNANPQKPEDLTPQVTLLREKGYTVRTTDEEKSFLDTNEQRIKDATRDHWARLDSDILEMTGIQRQMIEVDGQKRLEKSHNYFKDAYGKQNEKIAELTAVTKTNQETLEAANTELSALKSANPETQFQDDIKRIQEANAAKLAEKQTEFDALQKLRDSDSFSHLLDNGINKLRPKFKSEIKMLESIIAAEKAKVLNLPRKTGENGEPIFLKSDGSHEINIQDGTFKTIDQIFAESLADILVPVKPQNGTGQPPANGSEPITVTNSREAIAVVNAKVGNIASPEGRKMLAELMKTVPQ